MVCLRNICVNTLHKGDNDDDDDDDDDNNNNNNNNNNQIPEWLTAGVTFLIPKTRILKIQRTTDR